MTVKESPVALRARLRGALALPGESGYELTACWNTAVQLRPQAVVAVADSADVVETVRFAAEHGYRVAVQRTGHGAVNIDGEDVLLIHTERLDELRIDPSGRRARVGSGLLWQSVIEAAAGEGLAPIAGSAVGVGVVGFLVGGGIGPLVRTFGVSSDWVTGLDVVTGAGELLRVTADRHRELFWGLRGGKATLGLVCAVEIELVACSQLYGGAVYFDAKDVDAVVRRWSRWTRGLPEHANTSIALMQRPALPGVPAPPAGHRAVAVRFASTEPAAVCERLLSELRTVAPPLLDTVATIPYTAIGSVHADPTEPAPAGGATALLRELPDPAVDALLAAAERRDTSPRTVVELRLLGGAYGRPAADPSAFCQRDAAYSLNVITVSAEADVRQNTESAQLVVKALEPWSTGGMLPNFAAGDDPRSIRRRYDDATLVRLSTLGDRYDPGGVLRVGAVVRGV